MVRMSADLDLFESTLHKPKKRGKSLPFLFGYGVNYGYNLRRQFDKCTPIAKFEPQGA